MHPLNLTCNPEIKPEIFFEVMRDFRKGGLEPSNYANFIDAIKKLPPIDKRTQSDYNAFNTFSFTEISPEEYAIIYREVVKRAIEKSKKCWHPESGIHKCSTNNSGEIIVTKAHSIQNNGILDKIAENLMVSTYRKDIVSFSEEKVKKAVASIFWGFCNQHDAIFSPIETVPYAKTEEQNFLFAYRGFVVAAHKKNETSAYINHGIESENDIIENKTIFDSAILAKQYSTIKTKVIELDKPYPIAASSAFCLDFDFEGNPIPHSNNDRMEFVFINFFPTNTKSYFLISYFERDEHLYKSMVEQLCKQKDILLSITILIAAHVENVYFSPTYYERYIVPLEKTLEEIFMLSQSNITAEYLGNPWDINFFHSSPS